MSKRPKLVDTTLSTILYRLAPTGARDGGHAGRRRHSTPGSNTVFTTAITIDCPAVSAEQHQRDQVQSRGQFLARQEDWDTLAREIAQVDADGEATRAGMPYADLLSYGARADVIAAVELALSRRNPARSPFLMDGIEGLEIMLSERADNPMLASLLAQAHMDVGWAWRQAGRKKRLPAQNAEAFMAHFDRAGDILARFDIKKRASPHLAGPFCALHAARPLSRRRPEEDFEWLICLGPKNPAPMRAMGNYLSPRHHGDPKTLELQARRTAALTQNTWGAGGYAWVMLDTLLHDPMASGQLDVDFFVEGLRDIVTVNPCQHQVNLLAAYSANAQRVRFAEHPRAHRICRRIAGCLDWLVRHHLTEVHALIWGHAASGFDNNLRVPSPHDLATTGLNDALDFIAGVFAPEIAAGQHITFTPQGPTFTSQDPTPSRAHVLTSERT